LGWEISRATGLVVAAAPLMLETVMLRFNRSTNYPTNALTGVMGVRVPNPKPTQGRRGVAMEPITSCEHDWALIDVQDTWSGPGRLSTCSLCGAIRREWLPSKSGRSRRSGSDAVRVLSPIAQRAPTHE